MPKILTTRELAALLKCSERTIYRLIDDGSIPVIDLRSQYRFNLHAVLAALSSAGVNNAEEE